jgi:hypothetical protein
MLAWSAEILVRDCSSLLGRQAFLEGATAPRAHMMQPSGWGLEPLDQRRLVLITPCGMVLDSYCVFAGVRDP